MIITKLMLVGSSNVELPIIGALGSDQYLFKGADGLGPTDVDVFISNGVYQGSTPQPREIVIRVGLNPDYGTNMTAQQLREELYKLLATDDGDPISVHFLNVDEVVATSDGYVKRIEPSLFTKDPEVQVVISCLNAYLQAPSNVNLVGMNKLNPVVVNPGSAKSGFHMELIFTGTVAGWKIFDPVSGRKMQLSGITFYNGNRLQIDTRPSSRSINLITYLLGVPQAPVPLFRHLTTDSEWIMLRGGANTFETSSQLFNWGSVYFKPQYLGV